MTDTQFEKENSEFEENVDDLYFRNSSVEDIPEEEKNEALLILAFFLFPIGIYQFIKCRSNNMAQARKFALASLFGFIMLLFIQFLMLF